MGIITEQTERQTVQNGPHCTNLSGDRKLGQYWERQFCVLAAQVGKAFTPTQIGREQSAQAYCRNPKWNHYTLPDITIWTYPGEHHEIKHKNPTHNGMFGLEIYRFNALIWFANETRQTVMYTIHNHDLAGGRETKENKIEHWVTANVINLNEKWSRVIENDSWVGGKRTPVVPTYYWMQTLWIPLAEFWQANETEYNR